MNELKAHSSKLDAYHKALGEAVDSKDDNKMQLQIDEANSAVESMTKGAFKTIKPQLVPSLVHYSEFLRSSGNLQARALCLLYV